MIWPVLECAGRKLGYARVSTKDQKLRMQYDALQALGCDRIFKDHGVSGVKAKRPGLDKLLGEIAPQDTVIVFKLDRLGRSVLHLADLLDRFHAGGVHFVSMSEGINTTTPGGKMVFHIFSAVAQFQREIIVENTIGGIEAARRRGSRLGRPRKLSAEDIAGAYETWACGEVSVSDLAVGLGVHPATLRRAFVRRQVAVNVPPSQQGDLIQ